MPDGRIISQTDAHGVCRIVLDRPEKRNALTQPLMQALCDAVRDADADPAVRSILLSSQGQVFCAGADLGNLEHSPPEAHDDPGHRALLALAAAAKPLVAAVQGAAVGMGATMLLHMDAVYATPAVSLRMPFVELGLTPEGGATFLLPARIGYLAAARLTMLAEAMTAQEAQSAGLLTAIVDEGTLEETAYAAALRLAHMPPVALAKTKAMLRWPGLAAAMDAEQEAFRATLRGEEFAQAVAAAQQRIGTKARS